MQYALSSFLLALMRAQCRRIEESDKAEMFVNAVFYLARMCSRLDPPVHSGCPQSPLVQCTDELGRMEEFPWNNEDLSLMSWIKHMSTEDYDQIRDRPLLRKVSHLHLFRRHKSAQSLTPVRLVKVGWQLEIHMACSQANHCSTHDWGECLV